MGGAVPLRVVRRVGQAEVRAEVDHAAHTLVEVGDDRCARHVGQPQEHRVEADEDVGVVRAVAKLAVVGRQARVQVAYRCPGLGVAGDSDDIERRVRGGQAEQLCARVARRTDDADAYRRSRALLCCSV